MMVLPSMLCGQEQVSLVTVAEGGGEGIGEKAFGGEGRGEKGEGVLGLIEWSNN